MSRAGPALEQSLIQHDRDRSGKIMPNAFKMILMRTERSAETRGLLTAAPRGNFSFGRARCLIAEGKGEEKREGRKKEIYS